MTLQIDRQVATYIDRWRKKADVRSSVDTQHMQPPVHSTSEVVDSSSLVKQEVLHMPPSLKHEVEGTHAEM